MITPAYSATATERVLPRMALDFTTASLDSRVTVARALNTATAINSSGFIAVVNANLPRFDFDPVTLACKGLLIEESRANAFTYSQDFGNAAWTPTILDVSTDAATSPDGTTDADKLIPTTANGVHGTKQSAALSNGVAYTMSGFFKADGYRRVMMRESTAFGYAAVFDLISGTVVATTDATGTITNFGNGWYRCEMRFTSGWTNTSDMYIFVLPDNGTGYGSATFSGDGTSGVLAYGAQFEAGAFATSYIPTTTTSVTRNRDIVTMTGTNFSDWFNGSQGAFIGWFTTFASTGIRYIAAASASGAIADSLLMSVINAETDSYVNSGGVQQARLLTGTIAANVPAKLGLRYANANFAVAANGGGLVTQLSGSLPVGINQLNIGALSNTGFQLNGHMAKFFWYTSLTNAELVAFTK